MTVYTIVEKFYFNGSCLGKERIIKSFYEKSLAIKHLNDDVDEIFTRSKNYPDMTVYRINNEHSPLNGSTMVRSICKITTNNFYGKISSDTVLLQDESTPKDNI